MIKLSLVEEKKKKKKVSGAYLTFTTGNPDYNCKMFNKRMGTDFEDQIKDATKEAEKEADAVETAVDAEAAAIDAGTGATVNVAGPGEAAAEAAGDAGAGDAGAGDGGAAGGEGGGAMGESLEEAIDLEEDKIFASKLGMDIELPNNIKIIDKKTIEAELEKLEPEEEFEVGYVTPVYFYSELQDKFTLLKCTRLTGYTGVDYIEARANDAANKDKRIQVSKDAMALGTDLGRHQNRKPLAGKEAEFSADYASTNKTVKQFKLPDQVDENGKIISWDNFNTILFYPRVGSRPTVIYYLDFLDGSGYFEVDRNYLEMTIIKKLDEYSDDLLYGTTKSGAPKKPRWGKAELAHKIKAQIEQDAKTIDAVQLNADRNYETRSKLSNGVQSKPQVRALYTNQIYYIKTPYATIGQPLTEELALDEAVNYFDQIEKMKKLENGTRGFNAAAASDEKLRVNRQVCLDYNLPRALAVVEAEMIARGMLPSRTSARLQANINDVADANDVEVVDVAAIRDAADSVEVAKMCSAEKTNFKKLVLYLIYAAAWQKADKAQAIKNFILNTYYITKAQLNDIINKIVNNEDIMKKVADANNKLYSESLNNSEAQKDAEENSALATENKSENLTLNEAKREVRRYYIRPQNIYCANKAGIIKALIAIGDKGENCSVYSLKNLVDNEDVHKLTNNDIIYYYDEGVLYDKNHVRIMDYDLYVKKEEKRKHFTGTDMNLEREPVKQEYEDRLTVADLPEVEPDIYEAIESLNEAADIDLELNTDSDDEYKLYTRTYLTKEDYENDIYDSNEAYAKPEIAASKLFATGKYYAVVTGEIGAEGMGEEFNPIDTYTKDGNQSVDENDVGLDEAFSLDYAPVNAFGETLTEAKGGICCICGEEIDGYGNNPAPVKNEGRCCDACNMKFVIPARMAEYQGLEPEEETTEEE